MVLSVKALDRFWLVATVSAMFVSCMSYLRAGDIGSVNQMLTLVWGYWDFFRCVGDYEYDIKGISCQ